MTAPTTSTDTPLSVRVVQPQELTVEECAVWHRLMSGSTDMATPFLAQELVDAVARVRRDVEVAVIKRNEAVVGFLPFQRGRGDVGRPVLNRLSEFHGLVAPADLHFDAGWLLRECGLRAWHFGHVIGAQRLFQPFHWVDWPSPYVDLTGGFDGWRGTLQARGSRVLREVERKARKLAREVGPLRFQLQTTDPAALSTLIRWKSQQQNRTNRYEVLQLPWLQDVLTGLRGVETPRFCAPLSTLHAGDRLVALHFGVATPGSLHVWFPAYNRDYARYSPGLILFVQMARAAALGGIARIDFGKGPERYKAELATGATTVAQGSVDVRHLHRVARRSWHQTKQWARTSSRGTVLTSALAWSQPWRQRRGMAE